MKASPLARIGQTSAALDVEPLRDGQKAFQARLDLINRAKSSVILTTYACEPDAYGCAIVDALTDAALRGVEVTISFDQMAAIYTNGQYSDEQQKVFDQKLKALVSAGGFIGWYAQPKTQLKNIGHGQHYKVLIADGERAITGGRNIGASYFRDWTDFDAELRGPIVTRLGEAAQHVLAHSRPRDKYSILTHNKLKRAAYDQSLDRQREVLAEASVRLEEEAAGKDLPRFLFVYDDPTYLRAPKAGMKSNVSKALIDAMDNAENEILATSIYLNPIPPLSHALSNAAMRGADVLLTTTGANAKGVVPFPFINAAYGANILLGNGAEVYMTDHFEHGKMYAFDGEMAAFGSYNMEQPADKKLVEGLLFTDDPEIIATITDNIKDTIEERSQRALVVDPTAALPKNQPVRNALKMMFARLMENVA